MAEHLLHDFDVRAAGNCEASGGVSQLVRVQFGDADRLGRHHISALGLAAFVHRRCRHQSGAGGIVDDLRINMLARKMHRETGTFRRAANAFPNPRVNAMPDFLTIPESHNY